MGSRHTGKGQRVETMKPEKTIDEILALLAVTEPIGYVLTPKLFVNKGKVFAKKGKVRS